MLRARVLGDGQVTLTPAGGVYAESTRVTLRAAAAPGYTFAGWSGALEGTLNPAEITVTRAQEVKAFFSRSSGVRWLLPPAHDSYVRGSLYAGQNFDKDTLLRVREGASDLTRCRSLLQFDLSSLSGRTLLQAVLRLRTRGRNPFPDGVPGRVDALAAAGDSWTEETLTWKTMPAEAALLDSVTAMADSGRTYIWDVTEPARQELAGDRTLSLLLKDRTAQDRTVDFDSRETAFAPVLEVLTLGPDGVAEREGPVHFCLEQNYPNPFNPTTSIGYELAAPGAVRLAVYDLLGREVALLVDAPRAAGRHRVQFDAAGLATGTYVYRLSAAQFVDTHTMLVLK